MTASQVTTGRHELMLLRHAKAIRDKSGLDDARRPLTPRGEEQARAMGKMMAELALIPDLVLCSPAVRARQTWKLAAAELPRPAEARVISDLYDFGDGNALREAIRTSGGNAGRLMLVGHNPSMEGLANSLATAGRAELRARMADKFPTGALAVFATDLDRWDALADITGATLTHFICPRDVES
jgi:phosphohistidine phosphatase